MSKKNKKPTYRSLVRAGVVKPTLRSPTEVKPEPRFRVGDWVRISARESVNCGLEFKVAHYYYCPLYGYYRFCAATTDKVPYHAVAVGYPAENLQLVEGGLERSKGVLEGLTEEGAG